MTTETKVEAVALEYVPVADQIREAAESNRQLAKTIRQYGTCAPSALELVAGRLENLADLAAALSQPAGVAEGWVIVPKYPTKKMTLAMHDAYGTDRSMVDAFNAMLAASPAPEGSGNG